MKIAFLTNYYNKKSGIARCVAELAERFSNDHEVHVFAADWEPVQKGNIVFHTVPTIVGIKRWTVRNLSIFLNGGKQVSRGNFDITHFHVPAAAHCDAVTCHGLPTAGIKFLDTLDEKHKAEVPARRVVRFKLARPMLEYNYRPGHHRQIIAVSSRIKEELMEFCQVPAERITVIPNGVDLADFTVKDSGAVRKCLRDRLGFTTDDFVIIFVGNYFKRKGLQFLLQALKIEPDPKTKLLVVGHDRDEHEVFKTRCDELGISDRVVFAGQVNSGISDYYAASDLFVFPSFYESFGLVILEAMASGLPVISNNTGAANELVVPGENGYLLEDLTDAKELADKISRIKNDAGLQKQMRRKARTMAETHSWEENADKTLALYERIIAEKRAINSV